MTDVRLTATNPDDSSVVPVACNAKGELKLEEPIAPPGFDGNLDGDLTVSGSGEFAGVVENSRSYNFRRLTDVEVPGVSETTECALFGYTSPTGGNVVRGSIAADGTAEFEKIIIGPDNSSDASGLKLGQGAAVQLGYNGGAFFKKDVIVGSRSSNWMLVEQGGLCHMVEQTRRSPDVSTADLIEPDKQEYPKLRDVINELDLVEQALQAVMEKLRMDPPAGWPVWDGSA